jgi:hypothetical protein
VLPSKLTGKKGGSQFMDNDQARAYAKLAMKRAGLDEETIGDVLREMYFLFDMLTEEEAEKRAKRS